MKKELPLTLQQLKTIYGEDWYLFIKEIIPNCFCSTCLGVVSIVNYKIFVNNLNDIILRGHCAVCGNPVNRYIETGEDEEYVIKIKKILKLQRELK
jgi:hypothetical protein